MISTSEKVDNDIEYDVFYWRNRFSSALKRLTGITGIRALIAIDGYYNTLRGAYEYGNLVSERAGLKKTRKAALALEKYLETTTPSKKPKHLKALVKK